MRTSLSKTAGGTACRFLELPIEIRVHVYEYLLLDPPDVLLQPKKPWWPAPQHYPESISEQRSRSRISESASITADNNNSTSLDPQLQALTLFTVPFENVCNQVFELVHKIMRGASHPEQNHDINTQVVDDLAALQSAIVNLSAAYITHTDNIVGDQSMIWSADLDPSHGLALASESGDDDRSNSNHCMDASVPYTDLDADFRIDPALRNHAVVSTSPAILPALCNCAGISTSPAILRTNRQIFEEGTQLMYAKMRIIISPGLSICRQHYRLKREFGEIRYWNAHDTTWMSDPPMLNMDLDGAMDPGVFARFQKIRICTELDLSQTFSRAVSILVDDAFHVKNPQDEMYFKAYVSNLPLVHYLVDKISASPVIRHLEISVGLKLHAMVDDGDPWDGDEPWLENGEPLRDLLLRRKRAFTNALGTEFFFMSGIFSPLRQLSNVQKLTIIFNPPRQEDVESFKPSAKCVAAMREMEEIVEANFVPRLPWQPAMPETNKPQ